MVSNDLSCPESCPIPKNKRYEQSIACFKIPIWGFLDRNLRRLARAGKSKRDSHACRNLHRVIGKTGKRLPVKVSFVRLWVRTSRRRVHLIPTKYPMLRLPDWVSCSFQYGGQFFLGGCTLDDPSAFIMKLQTFWKNYKVVDPSLPFFRKYDESSYSSSVPIALHGDEGRGRAKQPIMVISVQPLLPLGDKKSNMEGWLS